MIRWFLCIPFLCLLSCNQAPEINPVEKINRLAENYVRLGLEIGQYDGDFVDAYYGPDSLKPVGTSSTVFPKDSLLGAVNKLISDLNAIPGATLNDSLGKRANWMVQQLVAFGRRARIYSGELDSFDLESKDLFGVIAPRYNEAHFALLVHRLDSILPGQGDVSTRFNLLANRFIIPPNKLDTVFKTAIAEARKRTGSNYQLPDGESFTLEFVKDKPWSGYNWYQGNFKSRIQINTDLPIFIERAIDLACHEGYPGHHVYNMLLEKNLYRDRGWVETSLYPLFSPQSLIAEGSANFGIAVAFPGDEQQQFIREVLLPLAGMDSLGLDTYMTALSLKKELNYVRNEVGRGILDENMTDAAAIRWLTSYGLFTRDGAIKSISFIKKYRSYVINYNYGQDLVKEYIISRGGTQAAPAKRWELFGWLLSNQVTTADLLNGQ